MQHTNFSCVHFLNLESNKQKCFLSYFNAVRLSQCLMLSVDVTLLISRMLQQLCAFSAVLFVLRTGSSNLQLEFSLYITRALLKIYLLPFYDLCSRYNIYSFIAKWFK